MTISSVLTLVLLAPLVTAILPEASSTAHDATDTSNGLRLALRFVALTVLPASLLVAGVSKQLLLLFTGGGSYLAGVVALEIIAIFCSSLAVQMVVFALLQAVARTLSVLVVSAATAGLELALSVLLIPHLDLIGAALARSLTSVVGMVIAMWIARDYMVRLDRPTFYVKAFACAAVPAIVVWTLSSYVSGDLITIVPYSLVGGAIFLLCARLARLLSDEDRIFLGHVLPRRIRTLLGRI